MGWVEQVGDEAEDILRRARCALPERISCTVCQDFVARVTNWELGLGQPGVRSPNEDEVSSRALAMLGFGEPEEQLEVRGPANPPHPEPLPYGDSFWWIARGSGLAYKHEVESQWRLREVKPGSRVRPPRPRGRPRLGPSERELRVWAADLRAFLQHVNHRRRTCERRWGHLRDVLREMLPRRVPNYEERLRQLIREQGLGEDRIDHYPGEGDPIDRWVGHICKMSKLMVLSLVAALMHIGRVGGEGRRVYTVEDVAKILEILLSVDGIAYVSARQIRRALNRSSR